MRPDNAKNRKEALRLMAWAIYPINTGPRSTPIMAYVMTMERATLGE